MDNLTVVVPTHNRPDFLPRTVSYYENADINPTLVIADSSDDDIAAANEATCTSASLSVRYLGGFETDIHISEKLHSAVKNVETEYLTLCADDDFVLASGIQKTVNFLEKNPSYVCSHGRHCGFRPLPGRNKPWFYWRPGNFKWSLDSDNPKTRLAKHLSFYGAPTYYAVTRSDIAEYIYEKAAEYTWDPRFGEILPTMLTALEGKVKQYDECYSFRSLGKGFSHETDSWADFAVEGSFYDRYTRFRECLAGHLADEANMELPAAETSIDEWMINYLTNGSRLPRDKARAAVESPNPGVTEEDISNPAPPAYRAREALKRTAVPNTIVNSLETLYRSSLERLYRAPTKLRERTLGPLGFDRGSYRAALVFYRDYWDEYRQVKRLVQEQPVELTSGA